MLQQLIIQYYREVDTPLIQHACAILTFGSGRSVASRDAGTWLPTNVCSIWYDAKEDVLASYQKNTWDLHLQEYSSLNSQCVCGTIAANEATPLVILIISLQQT